MRDIRDFCDHQECPSVDGIVYPDATVQLVTVDVEWGTTPQYTFTTGRRVPIANLGQAGELQWSDCAILDRARVPDSPLEIVVGEGSYGTDGFVALVESVQSALKWIAFCTCSNPFDQILILDTAFHARSTLGVSWEFPLNEAPSTFMVLDL